MTTNESFMIYLTHGSGYVPTSKKDPIRCWMPYDELLPTTGAGWYYYDRDFFELTGPFTSKEEVLANLTHRY